VNYDTAWTYAYDAGKKTDTTDLVALLYDAKVLSNGTSVCVGFASDSTGEKKSLILQLDFQGKLVRKQLLGTKSLTHSYYDGQSAHCIAVAKNGDFLIGGERYIAPLVMRLDSLGNIKGTSWYYDSTKGVLGDRLKGSGIINSIKETTNGKIICVAGDDYNNLTTAPSNYAAYIAFDSTVTLQRTHEWPSVAGYKIGGRDIEDIGNNTYLMSGNEAVVGMDTNTTELWKAKYTYNVDNVGSQIAKVNGAKALRDGRLMVIGQEYEPDSYVRWGNFYYDAWWAEIAFAYGSITTSDTTGYKGANDNFVDFVQLADDKLAFVGSRGGHNGYSPVWVVVTDVLGKKKLFSKDFFIQDSLVSPTQYPLSIAASPDNGFTIVGYLNKNSGRHAFAAHFVPKAISAVTNITAGRRAGSWLQARVSKTRLMVSIPAGFQETWETNEVSIFDMLGKRIAFQAMEARRNSAVSFDISKFPAGTYFVRLQTAKNIQTAKLLIGK